MTEVMEPGALLEVSGLQMRFGGLLALDDVSFTMAPGSITSVIGPNGAGKTTLFNCVTGMYRPTGGRVTFAGTDATGARANRIARLGIARTFQNLALFGGLTVLENLLVGAYGEGSSGLLSGAVMSRRSRAEQRRAVADAIEILQFLGLPDTADLKPSALPYGRQKQVEFARALMQKARLVMLDEPMAGMSAPERTSMIELIERVRARYAMGFLLRQDHRAGFRPQDRRGRRRDPVGPGGHRCISWHQTAAPLTGRARKAPRVAVVQGASPIMPVR